MAETSEKFRLFVAMYPPADAAREMIRAMSDLRLAPNRPVAPDHVHLTAVFLGDRPAADVEPIVRTLRLAARSNGPVTMTPTRLITLPERHEPRLVAMEVEASPNLPDLYAQLVSELIRPGDKPPRGSLLPHFTLCRYARDAKARRVERPASLPSFEVDRLRLMRSTLRPEGAEHTEVGSALF